MCAHKYNLYLLYIKKEIATHTVRFQLSVPNVEMKRAISIISSTISFSRRPRARHNYVSSAPEGAIMPFNEYHGVFRPDAMVHPLRIRHLTFLSLSRTLRYVLHQGEKSYSVIRISRPPRRPRDRLRPLTGHYF